MDRHDVTSQPTTFPSPRTRVLSPSGLPACALFLRLLFLPCLRSVAGLPRLRVLLCVCVSLLCGLWLWLATHSQVVYVVLESQYQASMSKAAQKINDQQKNVCVEVVGYLLEELRDEGNYAKFQEDVADANVFIGSLIFVQELAEKVEAAVAPLRDQLDAVIVFPSMPEVYT